MDLDLFGLIAHADPAAGFAGVAAAFDPSGWDARSLAQAVLAGPAPFLPPPPERPATRDDMLRLLRAQRFRRVAVRQFLTAFPAVRRLLLVHVPKCAGVDLTQLLGARFPAIPPIATDPRFDDEAAMFAMLRLCAGAAPQMTEVLVHGHYRLSWFMAYAPPRPQDRLFTVLREPQDIVLSHANYVVTQLVRDPQLRRGDTRAWSSALGLREPPAPDRPELHRTLALRVLRHSVLMPGDVICRTLGEADAASALAACAASRIEITDLDRYAAWLRESWGIAASPRLNVSRPILARETLDRAQLAWIASITRQDRIVYDRVRAALDAAGRPAIRGDALEDA